MKMELFQKNVNADHWRTLQAICVAISNWRCVAISNWRDLGCPGVCCMTELEYHKYLFFPGHSCCRCQRQSSRSRKPLQHFYSLGNEILQEVSDAKYLGIQIDNKLDWNKHISTVAARGQSKLAFLNRNLKGCPKKLRDTAYISLIRPALEYSCSVWHPHKKSNKDKIEKVQRRAARFVSNNFRRKASVSEMLHKLGWQSLDDRRQDQRLVLFFKIINGLASVETEDILTPADSRTRKNHSFKFKHLQANCDSYRYSFFPATISSWNNLPFGIEKVDSVN